MCLLLYFSSAFVMRFIHEPLARRIWRANSIPRYDINKLSDDMEKKTLDAPKKRTLGCLWYVLHKQKRALNWVIMNCSVPVNFLKWGAIKTI